MDLKKKIADIKTLKMRGAEITEVVQVEEKETVFGEMKLGTKNAAHVRVQLICRPEPDSRIRVVVWLPLSGWNGSLYAIGNGGYAGQYSLDPQSAPLQMGFAMSTTDLGTSDGPDCGITNYAARKDFGHRANHEMALAAKEVIKAFYGEYPAHSYFIGGSTGGQQALAIAQRYPEDFDGIAACAPAFDRVNLHLAFLWDWQHLTADGVDSFTQEDAERIAAAFLSKKSIEGERREGDNFFYDSAKIHVTRDIFDGLGFTEKQVNALLKVYEGAHDPVSGERIYEGSMVPGSEAQGLGLTARCDRKSFEYEFLYLFRWVLGADFDFRKFDFHEDTKRVREALSKDLDAVNPDLTAFRNRGGKLLLVHGTTDPIIPYTSSVRYFVNVQKVMGDTSDFFRMFLLPGMAHVVGGPGVQDYVYGLPGTPKDKDHFALCTLHSWVEEGKAPDSIKGVCFGGDLLGMLRQDGAVWEREIFPYAKTAEMPSEELSLES